MGGEMGTATGIWNHGGAGALPGITAMDSSTGSTSGNSSSDSATISANDFLTLLVTEMQNQDPTADTDPNEYINQLVNVNSLEQLISINQTLSTSLGGSGTTTGTSGASGSGGERGGDTDPGSTLSSGKALPSTAASGVQASGNYSPQPNSATALVPGNLSIPSANRAAQRVAESLSGH
jgi:flagellar basal-body rod modification protein FlgD